MSDNKSSAASAKDKSICRERGYHDFQEFIDPNSGGFERCKDCGLDVDREESEAW